MILSFSRRRDAEKASEKIALSHRRNKNQIDLPKGTSLEAILEESKKVYVPFSCIEEDFEKRVEYIIKRGRIKESKIYIFPYGNPYPLAIVKDNLYKEARILSLEEALALTGGEFEKKDLLERYPALVKMVKSSPLLKGSPLYEELADEEFSFPKDSLDQKTMDCIDIIFMQLFEETKN